MNKSRKLKFEKQKDLEFRIKNLNLEFRNLNLEFRINNTCTLEFKIPEINIIKDL